MSANIATKVIVVNDVPCEVVTITQAMMMTGIENAQYIRQLIQKGKIIKVGEEKEYPHRALLLADTVRKLQYKPADWEDEEVFQVHLNVEQQKLFRKTFPNVQMVNLTAARRQYRENKGRKNVK